MSETDTIDLDVIEEEATMEMLQSRLAKAEQELADVKNNQESTLARVQDAKLKVLAYRQTYLERKYAGLTNSVVSLVQQEKVDSKDATVVSKLVAQAVVTAIKYPNLKV